MPITTDVYTVQSGTRPVNFKLETQIHVGEFQAMPKGTAAKPNPIQWECTYVCEECGCLLSTFVGTPNKSQIPADVLASMTEHTSSHQ
jgi:hypothetical protein